MPIKRVQFPDGTIKRVEVPEGATNEQIIAFVQSQAQPKADFGGVQGASSTVPAQGPSISGQQVDEIPAWKRAAYGVASSVAGPIVGIGQMTGLMDDQTAAESKARIDAVRDTTAGGIGGFVGDVGMLAAPLSRIGNLSRGGQYAAASGAGAAMAGVQPMDEGDNRLMNTAIGGALGAGGQRGAEILGAAGNRAAQAVGPQLRQLYEAAKARGIDLTPAQISDSRALRFFQSQLSRLPLSGAGKGAEQRAAWNRQLAKEIGEDADAVTPEVYARAKARHSKQFEDLTSRNTLQVTDDLIGKLEAIKAEAAMLGDDTAKAVSNAVDAFYSRVGKGDTVPGRVYQSFDSVLGRASRAGNEAGHYLGQVRGAIQSAMDDSISAADQVAWRKLRQEYANRKTIRDLVAKSDGEDISPVSLMGRATANNYGKESMASGTRGGIGELARIGQRLKEPPSSGTAERLASMGLGAGAVVNLPVTLAALLGGSGARRAVDSSALAKFLMRKSRGQGAIIAAPYVRAAVPGIGLPLAEE